MSPRKARVAPPAPTTFEEAFAELQHLLERLEDGGLALETALALFDQATQLAATCNRLLDEAELRVTRLTPESPGTVPGS